MTRLSNYILTESRSVEIPDSVADELIRTKCSDAMNGTLLYRGSDSHRGTVKYMEWKPGGERVASNGAVFNIVNLLFSNLDSWSRYPKRNISLIGITDSEHGDAYGRVFVMLPFNGGKIGVCPREDMWYSFKNINRLETGFNWVLGEIINNVYRNSVKVRLGEPKDYNVLLKYFDKVDELPKDQLYSIVFDIIEDTVEREQFMDLMPRYFDDEGVKLIDELNRILDPSKNGFKLMKAGAKINGVREVWTDSPCVLAVDVRKFR